MVKECRTSTNNKSRQDFLADFKAFRVKISLYTPSSIQSDLYNQSTIQQGEQSKRLLDKGKKSSLD